MTSLCARQRSCLLAFYLQRNGQQYLLRHRPRMNERRRPGSATGRPMNDAVNRESGVRTTRPRDLKGQLTGTSLTLRRGRGSYEKFLKRRSLRLTVPKTRSEVIRYLGALLNAKFSSGFLMYNQFYMYFKKEKLLNQM